MVSKEKATAAMVVEQVSVRKVHRSHSYSKKSQKNSVCHLMDLEMHRQGHHFISVANDALKDPIPNITKPRHCDLNLDVYVVLTITTVID